jgi:hypothetical protein
MIRISRELFNTLTRIRRFERPANRRFNWEITYRRRQSPEIFDRCSPHPAVLQPLSGWIDLEVMVNG